MWIEKRGQQHRVYWRTRNETGPKKDFEPFGTREQATAFIELARASSLSGALGLSMPRVGQSVGAASHSRLQVAGLVNAGPEGRSSPQRDHVLIWA